MYSIQGKNYFIRDEKGEVFVKRLGLAGLKYRHSKTASFKSFCKFFFEIGQLRHTALGRQKTNGMAKC